MTSPEKPVVLIVEDNLDVAETYEMWLLDRYDVRHAGDGQAALDVLTDEVDVVLLDRMMPRLSGDEVLAEIRSRNIDCRVAMVTAVDPDFDIIEMGFDDYVRKPPTEQQLVETIEDLLARDAYTGQVREYHSLLAKRAALTAEKPAGELAGSEAFAELEAAIEALEAELDAQKDAFLDDMSFVAAIRGFDAGEGGGKQ
ncbi:MULTISPECIES: HalX domain-containing protein [unclassified Haladaptatus]|uniref:response regulator n=1 Tax=unclassified Haladaptatus TaxID=2622732 RepID=UPI0023E89C67|nr:MULTISPECIES: HalX domain-containing protein [unclassified Haladaptatus]